MVNIKVAETIINGQSRSRHTWHHDWIRKKRPDLSRADVARMHRHSDEEITICAAACYLEDITIEALMDRVMAFGAETIAEIEAEAKVIREEFGGVQ